MSKKAGECRNLDYALSGEWLGTNGCDVFSSGAVAGPNTRCYHALLLVACKAPGLGTFAPSESKYRPHYQGSVGDRDGACQQGAVWLFLLGPFVTAFITINNSSLEPKRKARSILARFEQHLHEAYVGQVSEVFDVDPPHLPRGYVAQA